MKEKQEYKVVIKSIDEQSNSLVNIGRDTLLIKSVLVNEEVLVRTTYQSKNYWNCIVVKVLKPSKLRTKSFCDISNVCGSCSYAHVNYDNQLIIKKKQVNRLFIDAKLDVVVNDVIGMISPYNYRNKMIMGFGYNKSRQVVKGLYEENSHRIVQCDSCSLHDPECDKIFNTIYRLVKKYKMPIFNEDKHTGLLRHVLIRKAIVTKEILVVIVVASDVFPGRKNFVSELLKAHSNITSIVQNVNARNTSVVLGNDERTLYGKGYITDILCGLKFSISASSFYQINHKQTEILYNLAISNLNLSKTETLFDSYCGIGTIGLIASKSVATVESVEINADAIKDAILNAKINNISNVKFTCGDAEIIMQRMAADHAKIDALIMDPPRSGATNSFLDAVIKLRPKKISYVSCNPVTLVRDLVYLSKYYSFNVVDLVDMFPHTTHVEAVVLLTKI
ncbi:MAG: 23S rRNA (uracil(1939)-C(5))-methyltransferase RlmD [Erysipelotrichaceae bacterium]